MFQQEVDFEAQWSQLVARAWADDALKQRLLAEPAAVLKEHGVLVPDGIQIKVAENTEKLVHLTLPVKPGPEDLSEEELHPVGWWWSPLFCFPCRGCHGCRACARCQCERGCS